MIVYLSIICNFFSFAFSWNFLCSHLLRDIIIIILDVPIILLTDPNDWYNEQVMNCFNNLHIKKSFVSWICILKNLWNGQNKWIKLNKKKIIQTWVILKLSYVQNVHSLHCGIPTLMSSLPPNVLSLLGTVRI